LNADNAQRVKIQPTAADINHIARQGNPTTAKIVRPATKATLTKYKKLKKS